MIDEFEGQIIADKYRIESILRDSDLGAFYRGWHVLMDKPVTVKILVPALAIDKRFVERFLAEAKAASQATHTNILNVTDFGTDGRGTSYAVYEEAAGETLKSLIARDGALPVRQALKIAKQVAAGLAAAHAKDLFHGGLNPDKVLVSKEDENETVKVFDFGAQPVGRNANADIEYLSPEQYADIAALDARSDIYSLGVVLYEMLAGVVPYAGTTTGDLKAKQESEPPAPLSAFRTDLPPDLEPMILSALSLDPERRYQTMRSFAEDLELLSGGVPVTEKAAAAAAPRKNIWQTAFIVLAGISILAVALIYATSVKKTDPTTGLQADAGSLPVQPIGPATGAQEENLAKLPAMTEAEIMAAESSNTAAALPGTMPGGDGFNAWDKGGVPPPGAPLGIPQGGQTMSIDPNGSSQFMPNDTIPPGCTMLPSGIVLCPKPIIPDSSAKPSPTPKTSTANTAVQPLASPGTTPKPMATPPKADKPATGQPNKDKPVPAKTPKNNKPKGTE